MSQKDKEGKVFITSKEMFEVISHSYLSSKGWELKSGEPDWRGKNESLMGLKHWMSTKVKCALEDVKPPVSNVDVCCHPEEECTSVRIRFHNETQKYTNGLKI